MAFALKTYDFPRRDNFSSYEAVRALHDSIKPTRAGVRRLKKYSKNDACRIKLGAGDSVHCVYHTSAVVIYDTDNTVRCDISWSSLSTRAFANACLPYGVHIGVDRGMAYVEAYGGYYYLHENKFVIDAGRRIVAPRVERRVLDKEINTIVRSTFNKMSAVLDTMLVMQDGATIYPRAFGGIPKHMLTKNVNVADILPYVTWSRGAHHRNVLLDQMRYAMGAYRWVPVPYGDKVPSGSVLRPVE